MTVISLTVLMGLMKEAVKGGEERGETERGDDGDGGCNEGGHLGRPREIRQLIVH